MLLNPYRFGAGSIDPNFAQRKLLLHFDGGNGSTTFTDSSASAHSITANGGIQQSSTVAKWGPSSCAFSGSGQYLAIADSDDWRADAFDFGVELWAYFTADPGSYAGDYGFHLIGQGQATLSTRSFGLFVLGSSLASCTIIFEIISGSTRYQATATGVNLALNTQHFFACTRDGNTLRVGLNGSQIATVDVTGVTMNDSSRPVLIGAFEDATYRYYMTGYIDDVRFSKGLSVPVNSVPTAAFPNS